ncbi:MAG: HAMP domain-containing sensor histidine kinase [Chloroflexota bacterium]
MFAHARRRLTLAYIVMFALVLIGFTIAFLVLISIVLAPNFDLAPDTSSEQAAQIAYDAAVERIGLALVAADVFAVAFVGFGAWLLAARTLRPIREAHERQQRFVADASHEMRTPLTAIRATTENALRPGTSPVDETGALRTIAVAAEDLSSLTADLLTLAQSADGTLYTEAAPFDLSVVIAERLSLRSAAGSPAPALVRLAPDVLVVGHAEDVSRICDNLVDNAFRYGGPDVRVEVRTRATERHAVLEVSDNGPGIASSDQAHLFEPFFRVRADAAAPTGTGLGLAITAALARRNRGRLNAESQPGRGSTFRLSLPRSG